MWRSIIVKILFRLLESKETYQGINDKIITDWMARQHQDQGFREYFRKRDLQLLKTMGIGLSETEYKIWLGQRLELLKLLHLTSEAFKIAERKKEADKKKEEAKKAEGGEKT